MSDIWIKTSNTATTKWRKALSIKIKRFSSTWVAAKVIWIKNTSQGWLRVWPTSGVFPITDPYITTTSSGSTPLYAVDNTPIRIGTTYYGRNGTWDPNGFTISSYTYTWSYYSEAENQPGDYDLLGNLGTGVYSSPSQALTISSAANATAADGKYISFKITANASNSLYSNTADSKDTYGKIKVIRRTPINISFAITGSTTVGSVLSVGSSWNITEARKPDASRTTIKWYRSNSATDIYSGGGRTEIASGVYQYTLVQADSGKYIVAEETTFNTGSDYDIGVDQFTNGENQVTAVTSIITSPYRFSFGNHLYVSSNGHIGLDSGSSSYTSMSAGRNIAILVKDLAQYYLAEYSDENVYHLYYRGYLYGSSAAANNAVDYQIKFYKDPAIDYCDVYMVRVGTNVTLPDIQRGFYASGNTGYAGTDGASFFIGAGSVFRVYFGGTPMKTTGVSWTPVADNLWDVIQTWSYPPGLDDSFTDVTSAINQSAPVPVTPTSLTATTNDSSKITLSWSGGSADTYLLYWLTGGTSSWPAQTFTGFDFTDTESPYEWGNGTPTSPTRGVTYYFFVKARNGTSPDFVYGANWYPAQTTGIIGKAPLYAPPTPNTPTSSGVTTTNITVSWTPGTNGTTNDTATSYEIFTNTTGTTPSTSTSGTTATSPVSYTYTASTSPSAQYFWVRGVTEGGNSAWSGRLSATPTALNPPGVVSNVASTAKTSTSIDWSWSAPTTGGTPTGYEYAISTSTTEPSTFTNLGSTTRTVTTSSLTANTDYYLFVKAKNADGTSAAVRNTTAVKTSAAVTLYTVSFSANGATGSPSVSSVTQTSDGGSVTLATIGTMGGGTNRIFGGWRTGTSSGTVYAFGSSFIPTANITLYAYYGTQPTCSAPAWTSANNFRRVNTESQIIWFTDYPTPSGAYTEIIGMQFQIDTGSSGTGTRLADDTRAYPGAFTYPYAGANTVWGFKCGKDRSSVTSNRVDDINFSTSARYARVRVRMRGIDGVNYAGTFTGWI